MGTEYPQYHQEFAKVGSPVKRIRMYAAITVFTVFVLAGFERSFSNELPGSFASEGLGIVVQFEPCEDIKKIDLRSVDLEVGTSIKFRCQSRRYHH